MIINISPKISKNSFSVITFFILFYFLTLSIFNTTSFAEDSLQSKVETEEVSDPLEPFNRGVFWLNDTLDVYAIEPVATVYDYVTPQRLQNSVRSFFINLDYPIHLVSDLLQLNFTNAGRNSARFFINSIFGFYGAFDVAGEHFGIRSERDDLGTAFGRWGIPSGPYLVVPILGPSNIRDGVGLAGDSFLSPTIGIAYSNLPNSHRNLIIGGLNSLRIINIRSGLLDTVKSAKEASLDYYSFVKYAHHQRRQTRIHRVSPADLEREEDSNLEFDDETFGDELENEQSFDD